MMNCDILENDMISSQEDELIFELILDVSQSVGHRAFEYYAKWSLAHEENRFVSILQYLDQYAKMIQRFIMYLSLY